jgi:hypothetical protein
VLLLSKIAVTPISSIADSSQILELAPPDDLRRNNALFLLYSSSSIYLLTDAVFLLMRHRLIQLLFLLAFHHAFSFYLGGSIF